MKIYSQLKNNFTALQELNALKRQIHSIRRNINMSSGRLEDLKPLKNRLSFELTNWDVQKHTVTIKIADVKNPSIQKCGTLYTNARPEEFVIDMTNDVAARIINKD